MKTKSFEKYLEGRLSKEKIAEIEHKADREARFLAALQKMLSDNLESYMKKHKIGFNEMVRRLHTSPNHILKIQRGEANLTLASTARLLAAMDKEPQDIFKLKK